MCCACIVVSLPSLKRLLKYRHMKSGHYFSKSSTGPTDLKYAKHNVYTSRSGFVELDLENLQGRSVTTNISTGKGKLNVYINNFNMMSSEEEMIIPPEGRIVTQTHISTKVSMEILD
jgi:uncharacterized beta-barrel protein YwiB (DUF1934 family)